MTSRVNELIAALRDPDDRVSQRAVEALIHALGDPDERVYWRAAKAIVEIAGLRALGLSYMP